MPVFRGVLTEAITESLRDAFSFRRAKTLMITTSNDTDAHVGPETMMFSDNTTVQWSDDEPVEW
jgi:hypothetical protein